MTPAEALIAITVATGLDSMPQTRRQPATVMGRALRVSGETTDAAGELGHMTQRVTPPGLSRGPWPGVPVVPSGSAWLSRVGGLLVRLVGW